MKQITSRKTQTIYYQIHNLNNPITIEKTEFIILNSLKVQPTGPGGFSFTGEFH